MPDLYEHDSDEGWHPFHPFISRINRNMRAPNLKFVDLDGDGHADVLITEDDALVWHASLAEAGFGPAESVAKALDEEKKARDWFSQTAASPFTLAISAATASRIWCAAGMTRCVTRRIWATAVLAPTYLRHTANLMPHCAMFSPD